MTLNSSAWIFRIHLKAWHNDHSTTAKPQSASNDATTDYKSELWQMADALRGSMDAAEYKHVVLGLIFLMCISDAFEERHAQLEASAARGPTRRSRTNTAPRTSSGFRPRRAPLTCWVASTSTSSSSSLWPRDARAAGSTPHAARGAPSRWRCWSVRVWRRR